LHCNLTFPHVFYPSLQVVAADLGQPDTLPAALKGVGTVFIVSPGAEDRVKLVADGVAAVKEAGVTTVVVVSVTSVATEGDTLFKKHFVEIEENVKASGLTYTFLRLPMFFDNQWANQGSIKGEGKIYSPGDASKPVSLVSVADIGAASAAVLADPAAHAQKTYNLVSDTVTFNDIVAGFTKAVGREIGYVQVPYAAAIEAMVGLGFPRWQAGGVAELFELVDAGRPTMTVGTADLEKILGRPPTTFSAWVGGVAAAFKA
jgi:uncharacterized protein YbjT (DUF2867 family)